MNRQLESSSLFRLSPRQLWLATLLGLLVSIAGGQNTQPVAGPTSQGMISGLVVDNDFLPFKSPGTISIRIPRPSGKGMPATSDIVTFGPTEEYLPPSNSALQRPYADGSYQIDGLAAGDYEVGMQVPDGYTVFYSTGPAEAAASSLVYEPYGPIGLKPTILVVHLGASQHVQLNWKFVGAPRIPEGQPVAGERFDSDDLSPVDMAQVSQVLSCNIDGTKGPLPGTDFITFDGGTSVWSKIGVNRDIGGIGVSWTLINHDDGDASIQIIDATSAGGAAWQSTLGLIVGKVIMPDGKVLYPINHFNQAAGNSAEVWGYRSSFKAGTSEGLRQRQITPLFSNDLLASVGESSVVGADKLQSPCYHTGTRFGNGRTSFRPTYSDVYVKSVHERVLQINSTYRFHALGDQRWFSGALPSSDEQAIYMLRSVAFNNDLRIYVHLPGHTVAGPVRPADPFAETVLPASAILHYRCNEQDPVVGCFLDTQPIDYAVLVWKVGDSDVAVAIHGRNLVNGDVATTFTGVINLRRALGTCTEQSDHQCGNVQWHSVFDLPGDADGNGLLKDGHSIRQKMIYDVGTVPELSRLGFRIDDRDQ